MAAAIRLSQQHSCSLDHLVGDGRQTGRDLEAERFRGFEIDHELEFCGLHHRQIARFGSPRMRPT